MDEELAADTGAIEVNLTTPESEVRIGGDVFMVHVKSAAPLGEVVGHASSLYRTHQPEKVGGHGVGFSTAQVERRDAPDFVPGTLTSPLAPIGRTSQGESA